MSGNTAGDIKAAQKNLANDPRFYEKIGSKGGKATNPDKGFGSNKKLARIAGSKGGRYGRRYTDYAETIKVWMVHRDADASARALGVKPVTLRARLTRLRLAGVQVPKQRGNGQPDIDPSMARYLGVNVSELNTLVQELST